MTDKREFELKELIRAVLEFFLEGLFAWLLWNGVGRTLLGLPHATFWQILGLTIMVAFILPRSRTVSDRLDRLIWDKDGEPRP